MPTYQKLDPGKASGLSHVKVRAAYGMQPTMATIAPAFQHAKPESVVVASWVYRPGKAGQALVKAGTVPTYAELKSKRNNRR